MVESVIEAALQCVFECAGELLSEGLMVVVAGGMSRVAVLRRLFGCGPYVEPEAEFTGQQLRQTCERDEVDAIQERYRAEPQHPSGLLVLGLASGLRFSSSAAKAGCSGSIERHG